MNHGNREREVMVRCIIKGAHRWKNDFFFPGQLFLLFTIIGMCTWLTFLHLSQDLLYTENTASQLHQNIFLEGGGIFCLQSLGMYTWLTFLPNTENSTLRIPGSNLPQNNLFCKMHKLFCLALISNYSFYKTVTLPVMWALKAASFLMNSPLIGGLSAVAIVLVLVVLKKLIWIFREAEMLKPVSRFCVRLIVLGLHRNLTSLISNTGKEIVPRSWAYKPNFGWW